MNNKIIAIMVTGLMICAGLLVVLPNSIGAPPPSSSPQAPHSGSTARGLIGSTWTQASAADFSTGTLAKLKINPEDNLELIVEPKSLGDDFIDEHNISLKNNVWLDPVNDTVELIAKSKTYGGLGSDECQNLVQTSDGGYALLGNTESYGGTDPDVWLVKLDGAGNLQWRQTYGGTLHDIAFGFCQTSDNGFAITGYTVSYGTAGLPDLWLLKTDASGNEQWNVAFDVGYVEIGFTVLQTADGGYLVGGHIDYQEFLDSDAWLIKTDSSGNELWNRTYGGAEFERCYDIIPTATGFAFTGFTESYSMDGMAQDVWLVSINSGGTELWNFSYGGALTPDFGNRLLQTTDSGFAIVGYTESYDVGMGDVWLVKTTGGGVEIWNQSYGGPGIDRGDAIVQTSDNGYAIVGYTMSFGAGLDDLWLIKTDLNGVTEWTRTYGDAQEDAGRDLLLSASNGFTVAGETTSYGAGLEDLWLLQLDSHGNFTGGRMVSTNLLEDDVAITIDEFECDMDVPAGTSISLRFSQDAINWYNSSGVQDEYEVLATNINTINLSALNWNGSSFYYELNFSAGNINVPKAREIILRYRQYTPTGTYISEPFNSTDPPAWKTLSWSSTAPPPTAINFQARTAGTETGLASAQFVGPDGVNSSYYTTSGTELWSGHDKARWLQYKLYLETTDLAQTPILNNVTVSYNQVPKLFSPIATPDKIDVFILMNFSVNLTDLDNDPPAYVRVCIDDINYTMHEGAFSGTDYTHGRLYWYPMQLSFGNYTYRFYAYDGEQLNRTPIFYLNVGPGPLDHIDVTPAAVMLTTDEYQIFTAWGYDLDNNLLVISPTWEISGGGTIDANGNFTATTPGAWKIYANTSGVSGSATAMVTVGSLAKLELSPSTASLKAGEYIVFETVGYDADGNLKTFTPTWDVSGGGTITQAGNFTASAAGEWTIYANASGLSAAANVTVTAAAIDRIVISPNYIELNVSDSTIFTAIGYDAYDNELTITPTWSVNGGGTITQAGEYTASVTGTWIVYANYTNVSGVATVKVNPKGNGNGPGPGPHPNGDGGEDDDDDNMLLFAVIAIIIIIIVAIILLLIIIKRKRQPEEPPQPPTPAAVTSQAPAEAPPTPELDTAQPTQPILPTEEHQRMEDNYRAMTPPQHPETIEINDSSET